VAKFSIIVPVYNVEKYLRSCLDSILNQTYKDYEVIIVNDGTKDNSQDIIDEYVKKDNRFKGFIKSNGGLSDARNYGVGKAKGDYLVFVDSDDDINLELLEEVNKVINDNDVDIIKIQCRTINGDNSNEEISEIFSSISGEEAFIKLINNPLFVAAPLSIYRTEFWKDNKFSFDVGRYHEDFGLIPYVYMKANKVSSISYVGYNYYLRDNSITTNKDEDKIIKRNNDILYFFDKLRDVIDKDNKVSENGKKYFKSYIANSLYNRSKSLEGKLFDDFVLEIKKREVYKYLLNDSIGRKFKRLLLKLCPKFYIKHFM